MVTKEKDRKLVSDVDRLFCDVEKHNGTFLDGYTGKALFNGEANQSTYNTMSDLVSKYKDTLDEAGLVLDEHTAAYVGTHGLLKVLRVDVFDEDDFLSFLKTLEPEQVKEGRFRQNLEKIPDVLAQKILDNYSWKKPTENAIRLFEAVNGIIEQYKRLDMTNSIGKLEAYFNHAGQGDLTEYVSIEKDHLLYEPGISFGPAEWQEDSAPEELEEWWGRALETLDKARANPRAQGLYQQLASQLPMCIKIAVDFVESAMEAEADLTPEEVEILEQKRGFLAYVHRTLNNNTSEGLSHLSRQSEADER